MTQSDEERDRSLRERLAEIRRSYIKTLNGHSAELAELARQAQAGTTGANEKVMGLVHKIAGTSGSFGIVEIADPAAALEIALMDDSSSEQSTTGLADLVERLSSVTSD